MAMKQSMFDSSRIFPPLMLFLMVELHRASRIVDIISLGRFSRSTFRTSSEPGIIEVAFHSWNLNSPVVNLRTRGV